MALYQIQNEHVLLELDLSNGITITRICDKATNHDYMRFPHSLFEFAVNNSPSYQSNTAVVVTSVLPSADGTGAVIGAEVTNVFARLRFGLSLTTPPGETAALLTMTVTNLSDDDVALKMVYPRIRGLRTAGHPRDMMGMVPHEIGSVVPLQIAPPGARLAALVRETKTGPKPEDHAAQEDLFVVGYDGAVWSTFVIHPGGWATPIRLTQPGLAPAGSGIAAVNRNDRRIDVFVMGTAASSGSYPRRAIRHTTGPAGPNRSHCPARDWRPPGRT